MKQVEPFESNFHDQNYNNTVSDIRDTIYPKSNSYVNVIHGILINSTPLEILVNIDAT
jgi:hypothetical protein